MHQLEHHEYEHEQRTFPITLLLHDMEIPMNIGSIFRVADALGVEKIYLSGLSIVPPNRKIRKTSRSTEQYVPYEYVENPVDVIEKLSQAHYDIVSLEITNTSQDLATFQSSHKKICLIIGTENTGVSPTLLELSNSIIHIPMFGQNSSMNVAAACSIAVYQLVQQHFLK